jgi:division/cell wall cluster transcriptional repressor MraZ
VRQGDAVLIRPPWEVATKFTGTERYQLDERLRVPLPPEQRDAFKPYGYVVTAADPCLEVHTISSFEEAEQKLLDLPEGPDKTDASEEFYSSAHKVTPDGQGRISIREEWAAWAGLTAKNPVVVSSVGTHLRLWNADAWERRAAQRRNARARVAGRPVEGGT